MAHSRSSSEASTSRTSLEDGRKGSATSRTSVDSDRPSPTSPNGVHNGVNGKHSSDVTSNSSDPLTALEALRKEKEELAKQYADQTARFNNVKTTLGTKLRQFAEELDRREQTIQQLSVQNEDMQQTIETLQNEVITSNAEAERASRELVNLRSRALEENSEEAMTRERELRELQLELEHCRTERDEWEKEALEGRVAVDEAKSSLASLKRELDQEREARLRDQRDLELEKEKSQNLQSVLEDFQAGKDHELREAVRDKDAQLSQVTQLLAEYKHRAHSAELQLEETSSDTSRTADLEKQVKEKSVLVEKLRHEAVIMNEHLMEALRRLRKNSTDNNVDRRLVTNVLLQFLTTPRADVKRFEMLGLLATILSWSDPEREKAGLQKASHTPGRSSGSRTVSASNSKGKGMDLETSDETESFSQRWVEFLLKEANDSSSSPPPPQSPTRSSSNQSLPGSPKSTHGSPIPHRTSRLASFTSLAVSSSPNLASSRTTQEKS